MVLLRPGNRLSITPVESAHWKFILSLGVARHRLSEHRARWCAHYARRAQRSSPSTSSWHLLVISIRVYILGPRTNPSNWRSNMAKAKKKAKKKAAKKK